MYSERSVSKTRKNSRSVSITRKHSRCVSITRKKSRSYSVTCKDSRSVSITRTKCRSVIITCKNSKSVSITCKDSRCVSITCKDSSSVSVTCKDSRSVSIKIEWHQHSVCLTHILAPGMWVDAFKWPHYATWNGIALPIHVVRAGGVECYIHSLFMLALDAGNELYSPVSLPRRKCFSLSGQ
jgi:hypothetical protein